MAGGKAAGAFALALGLCTCAQPESERPPNVLLILADDLGVECLGSYGGTSYRTPNLDALAAEGVRFTNAFCTPVCTPSRVQLLTGQYPFRNGWDVGEWRRQIGERTLDPALPSIGRLMRDAGYATVVAGKWQIARFHREPDHPGRLGFDEHCLWTYHLSDDDDVTWRFWKPSIWENGRLREDFERDDIYGPDVYADFLIRFLEEPRDEPFFAYWPMALTHRPYTVTPRTVVNAAALVEREPAKATNDWDRFESNVAYMDELVGRVIRALEDAGLREETLILFTADNGTDTRITSRMGEREIPGGKSRMTDLGAGVPLIASWPGTVPAGTVCADLVDFTDVLPTLADLAGVTPDSVVDGRSFLPQLGGATGDAREWVYVQLNGKWFIRDRRWRLHDDGRLFDVRERFEPLAIESDGAEAAAARARLANAAEALRSS